MRANEGGGMGTCGRAMFAPLFDVFLSFLLLRVINTHGDGTLFAVLTMRRGAAVCARARFDVSLPPLPRAIDVGKRF